MPADPNPYQPRDVREPLGAAPPPLRRNVPVSLGMILVGAVFCGGSFFVLVGHGIPALLTTYRDSGWLSFAFLAFYGLAGGLTALLHVSSLVRGCPSPENAGILAIPLALALTAASVAMMEYAIASLPVASR